MSKHNPEITLERKTPTKEKKSVLTPSKDESLVVKQFNKSIKEIKEKSRLYNDLLKTGKTNEAEDILRIQLVFLSSAVDYYFHEISNCSIIKMFNGEKEKTDGYNKILLSLPSVECAIKSPESSKWLEEQIVLRKGKETYQGNEKIRSVLNLNSTKKIIPIVRTEMKLTDAEFTKKLNDLYERRNLIAHQNDCKFFAAKKEKLEETDVNMYILFINSFIGIAHREIISG